MIIGSRLKSLREAKNLSQGDLEARTGLLRCYTSRVENGHTVPSLETLEKFARALEIPMYQLMYDGDKPPAPPKKAKNHARNSWESSRAGLRLMDKLIGTGIWVAGNLLESIARVSGRKNSTRTSVFQIQQEAAPATAVRATNHRQ